MATILRAAHSNIKTVNLTNAPGSSTITDMSVTVEIEYINDQGQVVTTVDDTIVVWAGMSDEMKQGVQAIVDAMATQVDAKYFN